MQTVLSPILTEKSALKMDEGLYVLEVAPSATKTSIKSDLKRSFDVDVISVRITNLPAKTVTFKRVKGVRPERRKAYIQLKKGQKLPGFELPKQKEEKSAKEVKEEKNA